MNVLTVAPLTTGIPMEELTYFSKEDIAPGDLVEIPIRKRLVRALVLETKKAEEERQSLRQASFGIRKVNKVLHKQFLPERVWHSIHFSSSYLLIPIGTIISDLISERAFDTLLPLPQETLDKGFDLTLLEQQQETRFTRYKTSIREHFSKKQSIVVFFPTVNDLKHAEELLSRGIEEYTVTLHSGTSDKEYSTAFERLQNDPHPLLILSTPSLLPWVRKDLGHVVIEREHSHYYVTHGSKGYDMRTILEELARYTAVPLLFGSHMLSLKSHRRYKELDAHESIPLQYRNDSQVMVVNMTEDNKTSSPYLSKQALKLLRDAKLSNRGHYFLYAHRKGMYPTTVCSDCGDLFTCKECGRPYVLHNIAGTRTYVCHGCENIVRLDNDRTLGCPSCGGWRMTTLGIATGGVEEELQKLGIPLFVIDGERTNTKSKVEKTIKAWKEVPFGLLIGTEMAHNAITKSDGVIILSLDSLFSLPEYRNDEKVLTLVTEMAEKVPERAHGDANIPKVILQTRLKKLPVVKQLTSPTFREVFQTLLRERERFLLPPYYTVIRATFENVTEELKQKIEEECRGFPVEWYEKGRGVTLFFVHISEDLWRSDHELRHRIKHMLSFASPQVNPLHFFID